jgi:choline dehydrogenase-like flavoprotein
MTFRGSSPYRCRPAKPNKENAREAKIAYLPDHTERWREKLGWQWHHTGATRMSSNPKTGVVDSNCKVHFFDNLYIAGAPFSPPEVTSVQP